MVENQMAKAIFEGKVDTIVVKKLVASLNTSEIRSRVVEEFILVGKVDDLSFFTGNP